MSRPIRSVQDPTQYVNVPSAFLCHESLVQYVQSSYPLVWQDE